MQQFINNSCKLALKLATIHVLDMHRHAQKIEDPFSGDANDMPTEKIADHIRKDIAEIL